MHVLGLLFLALMIGALLSPLDAVGAWLFDRKRGDW
jgi:hypothetical protein